MKQRQSVEVPGGRACGRGGPAARRRALRARTEQHARHHAIIGDLLDALRSPRRAHRNSAVAAIRFIVRAGALVPLPTSPGAFLTTRAFTLGAKLRLLREPFIAPAPPDAEESIAAFVRRRLGGEFLDYAIDPFVSGVYAGDPEQISVRAAFPRLHALEQQYGSLIKGQIKGARERRRSAEKSKSVAGSFSFRDGMQTLTDALALSDQAHRDGRAGATPRAQCRWHRPSPDRAVASLSCAALWSSLPAYEAAKLRMSAATSSAIDYAAIASVATAYRS
jgi:oxygen-dependent protoporphyrinogen oxidase